MKITVIRKTFTDTATLGEMHIDGKFFAYTLEDKYRGDISTTPTLKVPAKTAIDFGTYGVSVTFSNRFKRDLPLLAKVPCFEGVRIHGGNTHENTEGCILIGKQSNNVDKIWDCAERVNAIVSLIKAAGTCTIEIVRENALA